MASETTLLYQKNLGASSSKYPEKRRAIVGPRVLVKEYVKTGYHHWSEKLSEMYDQIKAAVSNNENWETMRRHFDELNEVFMNYMKCAKLELWRFKKGASEDDMIPTCYLRSLILFEDYVNKDDPNFNSYSFNDFKVRISEKINKYETLCYKCRNPPAVSWIDSWKGDNWRWMPEGDDSSMNRYRGSGTRS